jgi:hypothetical protein
VCCTFTPRFEKIWQVESILARSTDFKQPPTVQPAFEVAFTRGVFDVAVTVPSTDAKSFR